MLGAHATNLGRIEREVGVALTAHHCCSGDAGDVRVQLIGGLERHHLATRA